MNIPLTPKVESVVSPVDSVVESVVSPVVTATVTQVKPPSSADSMPCNWTLTAVLGSEDQVEAVNTVTNNKFTGTRKEFSAHLRGE